MFQNFEQLRHLTKAGYGGFYFGIESGDDNLLCRMHKGYTSEDIINRMSKLGEAGMPFVGNFLGGLGGHNDFSNIKQWISVEYYIAQSAEDRACYLLSRIC